MGGKSSRTKGHSFERKIAAMFREALPGCDARRGLQYRDGKECGDIVGVGGFQIECKCEIRANIRGGMRQAVAAMKKGEMPLVVWKDDRQPIQATLPFDDFLEILAELEALRNRP